MWKPRDSVFLIIYLGPLCCFPIQRTDTMRAEDKSPADTDHLTVRATPQPVWTDGPDIKLSIKEKKGRGLMWEGGVIFSL